MRIAKGKINKHHDNQHENEIHPYIMTMNGIIIDEHSHEFRNFARQIIMFYLGNASGTSEISEISIH